MLIMSVIVCIHTGARLGNDTIEMRRAILHVYYQPHGLKLLSNLDK